MCRLSPRLLREVGKLLARAGGQRVVFGVPNPDTEAGLEVPLLVFLRSGLGRSKEEDIELD